MFSASKVRAKITEKDPVFSVKYIGCIETFVPSGRGCTNIPVQKLWDNAGSEKAMRKTSILINTNGIIFKDLEKKKSKEQLFSIENISFCNAESAVNDRIFSWICKDDAAPSLVCHAVLCSSKEKAKAMALVLSRAFQIAYKEWKMSKTKFTRENSKQSRSSISSQSDTGITRRYSDNRSQTSAGSSENGSVSEFVGNNGYSRKDSECQTEVDVNNAYANGMEPIYDVPKSTVSKFDTNDVTEYDTPKPILEPEIETEFSKDVSVQAILEQNDTDTESSASK